MDGGMDSNLDPLLLPKNQIAFGSNLTIRGGFMTDRPPFTNKLNITWPSDAIQSAFEKGLFQCCGYYQPDSGDQSLFAQVSGRLFQFVINGNDVTVIERTISGGPNPADVTVGWMWQSENFLIVNNGISLPIFFDGSTSRRSFGPSVEVGRVTAAMPTTPPPLGGIVQVTLAANYTGMFNVPVLFNGEFYQPIENTAGYDVTLENVTDVPGNPLNVGDQVIIRGDTIGVIAFDIPNTTPGAVYGPNGINVTLTLTENYTSGAHAGVRIFGKIWTVIAFTTNKVTLTNNETVIFPSTTNLFSFGEIIPLLTGITPNVVIGTVAVAATAPVIGNSVLVTLSALYSGPANQQVFIGNRQYLATVVPSGTVTTTLNMINLSDNSTAMYVYGTSGLPILTVPELPAGRMGAYGLGQNWVCLVDGLSFICSDISRGPSGTVANSFRDSVLKTTDITFRGGNFAIPGAGNIITALTFTTNLDTALGQGSLEVSTERFMASCLAPIDFTNPPSNGPILTYSLIGQGPMGQDNTISVNSDIYFRSQYGIGSLILARRGFESPGNLPISAEMERVINLDNRSLLFYGSAFQFDNRILNTCSPQTSSQGVIHPGLISENLDTLSSLRGKSPPCYDGLWTGLNILKLIGGNFGGHNRQFAFTLNIQLNKIELFELLPTGEDHFDNESIPITWGFETGALFNKDVKDPGQIISLRNGEFAVDNVVGTVRFQVYYKSDQGCWVPWHSFSICSDKTGDAQYFPRLGLGEPDSTPCDPILKNPWRDGYTMRVKYVITGHCRFLRLKLAAVTIPDPKFQPPSCDKFVDVEIP